MGKQVVITENLISKLLRIEKDGYVGIFEGRPDMELVHGEIYNNGESLKNSKFKQLKEYYQVWAKIFMGCIFHRKPTSSSDYVNVDQEFLLYCLGKNIKIDLSFILFKHLLTH